MSKKRTSVGIAAVAVIAGLAICVSQGSASANFGPHRSDVVGVGSDASQSLLNILAEGATVGGTSYAGYNDTAAATKWSIYSTDASGADGLSALVADSLTGQDAIDFARSTVVPTADQENTASNGGNNINAYLDTIQIATDTQYIAHAATYNGPTSLPAADVLKIYTGAYKTWGDLAAGDTALGFTPTDAAKTESIVALLPTGDALTAFLKGLTTANGGTAPAASDLTNATAAKANDAFAVSSSADAIEPFSKSAFTLVNGGFVQDALPAGVTTLPKIALATTGSYSAPIPFYVVVRDADVTAGDDAAVALVKATKAKASKAKIAAAKKAVAPTAWQPGSTANWVESLFYVFDATLQKNLPKPFVFSAAGQKIIKAAGLTPTPYASAFAAYTDYIG